MEKLNWAYLSYPKIIGMFMATDLNLGNSDFFSIKNKLTISWYNYVFPQCAELAERLEEGDIFPPVEEIVCPLLFGAALHIQVTIIMVRCVFCHLGDFLSNWVAWSLCLSMDYSLAYCVLFCTAFPVSYYNLLSSCVVMVGQFSYSILLHVTISSTLVILNV